jgi:hypothetical protein
MLENDGVTGVNAAQALVSIDDELVVGEALDPIVLILKIKQAVIILKRPEEGEAVIVMVLASGPAVFKGAGTICPEDDGVVFFKTYDTGIECIEVGSFFVIVVVI